MVPTHTDGIGINHVLFHKDRNARGPATKIDTGRPKFLFILNQRRNTGRIGTGRNARQFQITAFDAKEYVLQRDAIHGQHMHVTGQLIANLATRISHARSIIQGKVNRLRMQHVTLFTIIWHVTCRHHAANIAVCDQTIFDINGAIKTIRLGTTTSDTCDHVVNTDVRHFLGCLHDCPNCAFSFLHRVDFAEFHTARTGCGRTNHTKR